MEKDGRLKKKSCENTVFIKKKGKQNINKIMYSWEFNILFKELDLLVYFKIVGNIKTPPYIKVNNRTLVSTVNTRLYEK